MDAKEAIEYLQKTTIIFSRQSGQSLWQEAHKMAISALEKVETLEAENARLRERETPKEPINKEMELMCPNCNEVLMIECDFGQEISMPKHCWACGQAIKNDKE